jgi:hypothetical protein
VVAYPPPPNHRFTCDVRAARDIISSSRLDSDRRASVWRDWVSFCKSRHLTGFTEDARIDALLAFAVAVRTGNYGRRITVHVESAQKAVRFVCQKWEMDYNIPDCRKTDGNLKLPFRWLFDHWRHEDPASKQQLALPYSAIQKVCLVLRAIGTAAALVQADLILVAFFYLLRPGEYTHDNRRRRTIPLRRKDIRLWDAQNHLIPHDAPLPVLLTARSATLYVADQKNGVKGSTLHHTAILDPHFCPVKALAHRVFQLHQLTNSDTTPLSQISATTFVTSREITIALRQGASAANLLASGYSLDRISGHSLRASGAMALKLNGADIATIKKMGRWSSDTFLMYIHSQISSLTAGLSQLMTIPHVFHNVGS